VDNNALFSFFFKFSVTDTLGDRGWNLLTAVCAQIFVSFLSMGCWQKHKLESHKYCS